LIDRNEIPSLVGFRFLDTNSDGILFVDSESLILGDSKVWFDSSCTELAPLVGLGAEIASVFGCLILFR